jgi:hypothetical protein
MFQIMSGAAGESVAQRRSIQPPYCLQESAETIVSVNTVYRVGDDKSNLH